MRRAKLLTSIIACAIMVTAWDGLVTSASSSYIDRNHYFNFEKACVDLGKRYSISPEMIEAVGEQDAYMHLDYGKMVIEVDHLHNLYVELEDNYDVLMSFFPSYVTKFSTKSELVEHVISRARQLERQHGKLTY